MKKFDNFVIIFDKNIFCLQEPSSNAEQIIHVCAQECLRVMSYQQLRSFLEGAEA